MHGHVSRGTLHQAGAGRQEQPGIPGLCLCRLNLIEMSLNCSWWWGSQKLCSCNFCTSLVTNQLLYVFYVPHADHFSHPSSKVFIVGFFLLLHFHSIKNTVLCFLAEGCHCEAQTHKSWMWLCVSWTRLHCIIFISTCGKMSEMSMLINFAGKVLYKTMCQRHCKEQ